MLWHWICCGLETQALVIDTVNARCLVGEKSGRPSKPAVVRGFWRQTSGVSGRACFSIGSVCKFATVSMRLRKVIFMATVNPDSPLRTEAQGGEMDKSCRGDAKTSKKTNGRSDDSVKDSSSAEESSTLGFIDPQRLSPAIVPPQDPSGYQRRMARSLTILACLATVYAIYVGRSILMPVITALVLALLFRPIVRRLARWRIPEVVGAGLVLIVSITVVVGGGMQVIGPAAAWVDRTPLDVQLRNVARKLKPIQQPFADFNDATAKIESFAGDGSTPPVSANVDPQQKVGFSDYVKKVDPEDKIRKVEIQQPSILRTVLSSTGEFLASSVLCLVLLYFLLALGDTFLNNVVQIIPRMREKKEAVQLIRNVEQGISAYLLMVTTINTCLGIVIGVAMWMIGLPNPALWGVMATVLNFIPYVGAFSGAGVVLLVGLFSFDTLGEACIAPAVYFIINTIEGNLITPALLGHSMRLNPIMVFLSLTFWGWMWGIGGALLAIPLLAIFKTACEQFERTRHLAILVGR